MDNEPTWKGLLEKKALLLGLFRENKLLKKLEDDYKAIGQLKKMADLGGENSLCEMHFKRHIGSLIGRTADALTESDELCKRAEICKRAEDYKGLGKIYDIPINYNLNQLQIRKRSLQETAEIFDRKRFYGFYGGNKGE